MADARQYTAYAYNLRYHGVYSNNFNTIENPKLTPSPDAFRSPGYPLFLYLFTSAKSAQGFAVNVFYAQALISTLTIVVAYILGRMAIGIAGGAMAGLLTAISPHLINLNVYLLTETLFTFFLVSTLVALAWSINKSSIRGWIASGICLAAATLIKPTLQYFIVFLIFFIFVQPGINQKRLTILMIALPFIVIFSGWLVRNMITMGYLSDPSLSIYTLQHGMYPQFMFNGEPRTFGYPYRFDPDTKQITSSLGSVVSAIVDRFVTRPGEHLLWFISKPLYLFRWDIIQGRGTFIIPFVETPYQSSSLFMFIHTLMRLAHPVLVGCSLIGSGLAWLPSKRLDMGRPRVLALRLLSLIYLYFILIHIAGAPFPRYSVPLRPITYVLAMATVWLVVHAVKRKIRRSKIIDGRKQESQ
jgi:4-amino-4-deoxy-L-arabinose transferase-like glycosyltransferase